MKENNDRKLSFLVTFIAIMPFAICIMVITYNKYIGSYDEIHPYTSSQEDVDEQLNINNLSDNIHFADPQTKLICLAHWDNNDDGELTYAEAASATSIDDIFKKSSIKVFAELKYFTGLTYISESAFEDCYGLRKIKLPNSITSIEDYAFRDCHLLRSIHIPSNVTKIGDAAFKKCCKLEQITLGENIKHLGEECFADCWRLSRIYFKSSTPPKGGADMFEDCHEDKTLYVPTSSLKEYRTTRYYIRYIFDIEPWAYKNNKEENNVITDFDFSF